MYELIAKLFCDEMNICRCIKKSITVHKRPFFYPSFSSNHPGAKSKVELNEFRPQNSSDDLCLLFCLLFLLCTTTTHSRSSALTKRKNPPQYEGLHNELMWMWCWAGSYCLFSRHRANKGAQCVVACMYCIIQKCLARIRRCYECRDA